jgi:hypothetical protein
MPAINKPSNHFDVRARAGNGVSPSAVVTDLNFTPNLVWTKQRDAINYHIIADNISRSNVAAFLSSNATDADNTASGGGWFQSFDTNGYTTRAGSSDSANVNKSGVTYVDWVWKAGGTAVTNTTGTISAQVSANPTAGFSIVSYTGPGSGGGTVGHGLGVAPSMIIIKNRSAVESWRVGHSYLNNGSSPWTYYINLNGTGAQALESSIWNNTAPSSSVFTIANDTAVSGSGNGLVAYCFAPVAGYSAFGSYTGIGNTGASTPNANGPFVYTGFRPKFVLIRKSSASGSWVIYDSVRGTYNANLSWLYPNSTAAESSSEAIDFLSNGFKIRSESGNTMYPDGATFIYAAFAEAPFKFANGR